MNKILDKLTALIENHKIYIIDGALNRNLLAADARKYDPELLNLLQKDKGLKEHFYAATDGGLVFKKDVFLQFIMNKEFLPDSYTKYKIKIGLGAEDGSLLSESGDVVLNWPYKDAILEGGQDKEDQKRSEVFFNEVLAPDQITRLLDDKVFTNWKRYDKDGEHELEELRDEDNLIIKGNNLIVLHSLKKRYAGKVKLIYIDPPYNTGNDGFGYNDSFNHSSWLTFMKNRLEVAHELLAKDGMIFIQCDDNEQAYLKVLLDEIFDRNNFINNLAVKMSEMSGVKMAHVDKRLPKLKEYILVYGKSRSARVNPVKVKKDSSDSLDKYLKYYGKIIENPEDQPEKWSIIPVLDFMKKNGYDLSEDSIRDFKVNNAQRCVYRTNNKSFEKLNIESKIARITSSTGLEYIWWEGKQMLFLSDYIEETLGDLWTDISTINLNKEGGVNLPNGKKPEKLIARIIDIATKPGDIVLDYHLGSGTTAAVAHKMKRQYIGVEQLYYGDNDPTKRLQNVINGDQSGVSKSLNWQGSGSFVYTNIMNNSNKFRKRIESAKTDADYLQLLKEATSSSFLSYRVDPKKLNEEEFRKLSSAEKRRLLLELIDNNTLYVNYEDINDPLFKVSEADKKFNAIFYDTTNEKGEAK